ncbi:MAG: XkdF-like putative serine protease domain-containing protein [Egibacteraceae bacterium]
MGHVQRLEDGDGLAFRWGEAGRAHGFRPGDAVGGTAAFRRAVAEGLARGETVGMSDLEREVAREHTDRLGIAKDAGGNLIIAWYLPEELSRELAIPGGEAPEDLHLTVLYLGDPEAYDLDLVAACLKLYTWRCGWPRTGRVGGLGRFIGEDDQDVIVALVDIPELENLRRGLIDDLSCYGALNWGEQASHGFVPHVTLAYVPRDEGELPVLTEAYELAISELTLAFGAGKVTFQFNDAYRGDEMMAQPAYYAARSLLAKAGRVVSSANMKLLEGAKVALQALIDAEVSRRDDGTDKATWSGAYVNDLPDSAFLHVEPGGEKDEDGKTKPRSLRHWPYRDADGQVDLPHLRNALSRIPQTKGLSQDVRDRAQARAEKLLADAQKGRVRDVPADEEVTYAITKATDEKRYTFGPLYAPDRVDAHAEWTDGDSLQTALWEYVRESSEQGRRLNLQHEDSGRSTIGEWVEAVSWPYETEIELTVPGEETRKVKLPAGTVYMGVVWDEAAWPAVKSGKIGGLSLGGRAVRVRDAEGAPALDAHMGDKVAAVTDSPAPDPERAAALELAAVTGRVAGEAAALRDAARGDRGLVGQTLDALKAALGREVGDTHIHVPDVSPQITIHEPTIEVKPTIDVASPVVNVNAPARVKAKEPQPPPTT